MPTIVRSAEDRAGPVPPTIREHYPLDGGKHEWPVKKRSRHKATKKEERR